MPNLHTRNPLRLPGVESYFDLKRPEIVLALQANRTQGKRIIEIGCGGAATSAAVKNALNADYYVGIEVNEQAAERARAQIDKVIVADLNKSSSQDLGIAADDFDLLLALDVLEHLYNPWDVLADWARVLRPGGRVMVSIPNMQNIELVAALAHGQFQYDSAGLRDATHIRFFTEASAIDLVQGAGLVVVAIDRVLSETIKMDQVRATNNSVSAGKLTISGLDRGEVTALNVWQFLITGQRPLTSAAAL